MTVLLVFALFGWFHAAHDQMARCPPGVVSWDSRDCSSVVPVSSRQEIRK